MSCVACRSEITSSKVKVAEGARFATFRNEDRSVFHRTRVDGCLIRNATAADFVVTCVGLGSVVVELKGTDVEHAVEQIDATVTVLKACAAQRKLLPLAGLIVCARYPRFDTKLQRLTKWFVSRHKSPVHVVARNDEFDIRRILAFDGPR